LDFKQLPGSEAQGLARELAVTISRLSGARLAALSQVADTGAWAFDGSRSMAHALARTEDAGVGVLKAELRLAEHLDLRLPLTAVALRAGQVSLEQAKVIARWAPTSDLRCAALADPETGEAFLLAKAHLLGVQELTQVTRYWAYRADPEADDRAYRQQTAAQHVVLADTLNGCDLTGFLTPETSLLVRAAFDAIIGDHRSTAQRQGDALATMARFFLDSGTCGTKKKVLPHLNVTVPFETLVAGAERAGVDPAVFTETCQPIPRSVLDRLSCDAEVTRIIFGPDGAVLDVGRTARIVSPEQRRAVIARDKTCRGPGCHAPPALCEVHHLIPWSQGGVTSVENSGLLCWHHHDWLHANHLTLTHEQREGLWEYTDARGFVVASRRHEE
jgi:hypothetical protein